MQVWPIVSCGDNVLASVGNCSTPRKFYAHDRASTLCDIVSGNDVLQNAAGAGGWCRYHRGRGYVVPEPGCQAVAPAP